MTSPNLEIHGIYPPKPGELDMPAKAKLIKGKYWYVEINYHGASHKMTQWRNKKHFTESEASFLEQIINNQILSGHFRWDEWFPHMKRRFIWREAFIAWQGCKSRAPSTQSNIKYKYQHYKDLWKRDIRELHQSDFLWIRERHGDTHKAHAIRQVAQAFLNWAYKAEMLDRPIFLPVINPPKKKTPYLPIETRWAIYHAMEPLYQDPMMLGLDLGMRIGEICALQWQDIDWEGEGITVCHTISAYKLKEGRKEDDEIWLPMSLRVKEVLMRLRAARPAISGFVFTHQSGKQIWTQQLSSEFKKACRAVGVPNSTFHHLRNSFLHDLSEAGATTREAGALAGHKREQSTEHYIGRWSKDKIRSIASLRKTPVSD